mmetsp:Transcript_5972/g.11577  ORF Transcript_5972/g.11577 Transcript_5972/m.11577 type:complete len:283 (+) Transcript_5972:131-979(+)
MQHIFYAHINSTKSSYKLSLHTQLIQPTSQGRLCGLQCPRELRQSHQSISTFFYIRLFRPPQNGSVSHCNTRTSYPHRILCRAQIHHKHVHANISRHRKDSTPNRNFTNPIPQLSRVPVREPHRQRRDPHVQRGHVRPIVPHALPLFDDRHVLHGGGEGGRRAQLSERRPLSVDGSSAADVAARVVGQDGVGIEVGEGRREERGRVVRGDARDGDARRSDAVEEGSETLHLVVRVGGSGVGVGHVGAHPVELNRCSLMNLCIVQLFYNRNSVPDPTMFRPRA